MSTSEEAFVLEALAVYRVPIPISFVEGHFEDEDFEPEKLKQAFDKLLNDGIILKNEAGEFYLREDVKQAEREKFK